jgi:hypothetical protein
MLTVLSKYLNFATFRTRYYFVGFEVLTAVVMKSTIFWDITPCSPLSVNRRFGGTYLLHLRCRKNKLSKKPGRKQVASRIIHQTEFRVYI